MKEVTNYIINVTPKDSQFMREAMNRCQGRIAAEVKRAVERAARQNHEPSPLARRAEKMEKALHEARPHISAALMKDRHNAELARLLAEIDNALK